MSRIDAVTTTNAAAGCLGPRGGNRAEDALTRPAAIHGIDAQDTPLRRLRQAADRVVGSVFYGILLKQLRSSALKGAYGHGGRGEDVFGAQLDQVLAERTGEARGYSLSDALVRRLIEQQTRIEQARSADDGSKSTFGGQRSAQA